MHETDDDIARLQSLLDESDRHAGPHLREIITAERRVDARATCERLTGMRLLALATVSEDGRPFVGPVDGVFFRGSFHFSSSPDSLRVRHIGHRPFVSATHLPNEKFAVSVHGQAVILDATAPEHASLRQTLSDIYV
ncbi:MAG: pyridoxamine 5'-phosphate oxidase family protein, partial [Acidimicrobiales bacterium]